MTRRRVGLLAAALVVLAGGCSRGTDDEMEPRPTKTITATPSQSVAPAPAAIPVGDGAVSPADVVWSQDSVLHVGRKEVDLAPIDIEALVVVRGGVFLLAGGELWFTDLSRLRGTGQTDVSGLQVSADAAELKVVDNRAGQELEQGYDTRTGKAVRGEVDTQTPDELRQGPGRFEVTTGAGGVPTVVEASTGTRVRLTAAPRSFELGAWASDSVFYGVGREGTGPRSVISCDAANAKCLVVGRLTGADPVVFGTGR